MSSTPNSQIPPYRKILKEIVPAEYLKPDNTHLWWLIPHFAIIFGSFALLALFPVWWLFATLPLVIGHSFGCLGFIAHEICHGGAMANKKLRHLLAGIAFSPFGIGPFLWSKWHNAEHHGHTQHADIDPDRLFLLEEYQNKPVLKWLYQRSKTARNLAIFGFYTLMMTEQNFTAMTRYLGNPEVSKKDKTTILIEFILPNVFWIGLSLMLGWQVLVFGFIVPMLIANFMVISYISTNHFLNPLVDESDVLASSLSVTLPKWLGWLDVLHSHFGAHVSHHLFPQAPSRHSRKVERIIAEQWPHLFHEMPITRALKLLWDTPWIYDETGKALIDPHKQELIPTLGNGLVHDPKIEIQVREVADLKNASIL